MTMTALSGLSVGCGPTRWGFYFLDEEREVHELKVLMCKTAKQKEGCFILNASGFLQKKNPPPYHIPIPNLRKWKNKTCYKQ